MTHSDSGEHRIPARVVNMAGGGHGTAEERMLVERARSGNQEAFEKLVHLCDRGVLRLAYRMLGNAEDAQDAYQETFLKAFRYLRNFRFESSLNTWIYQISTNVCLDRLRQRQKRRESTMDDSRTDPADAFAAVTDSATSMASSYTNPERRLYGKELGEQIDAAVRTLSEKERLVFEMKHYGGFKLRIIGEILETSEGAAKNYLFRATRKLRAQLARA